MSESSAPITPGSGTNVATDLVATKHYQRFKLNDGTTDSTVTARVSTTAPGASDAGLVVRDAGQVATIGAVTETAPATDTASSGINGRLQRIAQRISSLIAVLPTALSNGNLKVSIAEDLVGSTIGDDDGSIAGGQTAIALTLGMGLLYDGSAWVRGGLTPYTLISAASTNATGLKASAGVLGMCVVTNVNAAVRYLKLYNKASAPTVGTDTPVQVYAIPGSTTGGGIAVPIPDRGLAFSTGIAFAMTTGVAHTDTNGVAANEIVINLGYR